ncbi:hypothetical protein J3E68DRAFT_415193 [Trichoderma sp. SZMC 28012]
MRPRVAIRCRQRHCMTPSGAPFFLLLPSSTITASPTYHADRRASLIPCPCRQRWLPPHPFSLVHSSRGVAKCQPAWRKAQVRRMEGVKGQTLRTKGRQLVWLLVGRKRESRQHAT